MLRTLAQTYARAPERDAGLQLVQRVLRAADSESVRDLAVASLREVCSYAHVSTPWTESSQGYGNAHLRGSDRVIDICGREAATTYVNLPGGRTLYDASVFASHGLQLRFVLPRLDPYGQPRAKEFVPGLSVLDLVMSVPCDEVRRHLSAAEVSA